MTDKDRSDKAHDVLDAAVLKLRELGFEGIAAHRMMAWTRFDAIRDEATMEHAIADLQRLRDMLDKHLSELEASG